MSYILNALRKSEQERQAIQPETVTDRILAQQHGRTRKTAKWISAIILCNVLIVAGFIWYAQKTLAPSETHVFPDSPTVENAAVKSDVKPITKMNRAPGQSAKSSETASASAGRAIAANNPSERRPQPSSLIAKPVTAIVADATSKVKKSSINKEEKPMISDRQAKTTISVSNQSKEKIPETAPIPSNAIPFFYELPYELRQSIPKMTINVFVYSSEPAERFVMINMVKYKAGQQTKDSVEIKDIRPESLVLSYENQLFQIERP